MPLYEYVVIAPDGSRRTGRAESNDPAELENRLEGLVLRARPVRQRTVTVRRLRRDGAETLALVRSLASLVGSGMPIVPALETTVSLVPERACEAVRAIANEVRGGKPLYVAFENSRMFSPATVGLVRAGEAGGTLASALNETAAQLDRDAAFRARITSAAVYPSTLLAASLATLTLLIFFVLPQFAALLEDAGARVPFMVSALLAAGRVVRDGWLVLLAGAIGALSFIVWFIRTPGAAVVRARVLTRTPVLGGLRRDLSAARFGAVTGSLVAGGATLPVALSVARECIADPLAKTDLLAMRAAVLAGESLHAAAGTAAFIPEPMQHLIRLGEQSGELAAFLSRSALILRESAERRIQRLTTLLEPAIIVGLGGLVGLVALALLQAVYGLNAGVTR